jgi:O-antigen ligase
VTVASFQPLAAGYGERAADRRSASATLPLWLPLASSWILLPLLFTLPGREGPESLSALDPIALAKVAARLFVLGGLSLALVRYWTLPRRKAVMQALCPFCLFVAWAGVSTAWSALPAVSLGQAAGLAAQVMLAASFALAWRDPQDTSRALWHLSLGFLLLASIIVLVDLTAHEISGLNRADWTDDAGATGLVHPSATGALASIGLVSLVAIRLIWAWPWARALWGPGVAVYAILLVLSSSRTAIFMAAGLVGLTLWLYAPRRFGGALLLGVSALGAAYLIVDPGMEVAGDLTGALATYLQRGESAEQLSTLTGRTELWQALWASWKDSPIIGHGYFVTSRVGWIDVWTGPMNRTGHNALVQIVVSTGLVGLGLFVWAVAKPVLLIARTSHPPAAPFVRFLLIVGLWTLGWGQLGDSIAGPIQPDTVLFFSVLGLGLGYVATQDYA